MPLPRENPYSAETCGSREGGNDGAGKANTRLEHHLQRRVDSPAKVAYNEVIRYIVSVIVGKRNRGVDKTKYIRHRTNP